MSEMKMSDVFDGSIKSSYIAYEFDGDYNYQCVLETKKTEYTLDNELVFNAVIHAINNHDSLVEEVERLRGERDELVEVGEHVKFVYEAFSKDINQGYKTKDKEFAVDLLDNFIKTLAKIKGEDNE